MSWIDEAECTGYPYATFFPYIIDDDGAEWYDDGTIWEAYGDTSSFYDEARAICSTCPVRLECLEDAMETKERFGMRGGLTPIERRRIERKERRAKLKAKRAEL